MTDRIPLDHLTSDQYDQLCDDLDRYEEVIGEMNERAINQERELAELRTVSRGYCPACGRGDAGRTADDWEQQRQRADQATRERDEARQHTAAIAAQRDRLRMRMNTLADRWDNALAVDKPYAHTLRAEISVGPFEPDAAIAVKSYRADDGSQKWAARCWGTDTCDGWLSLDHDTQRWAEQARDRHVAEAHAAPAPAATQATDDRP